MNRSVCAEHGHMTTRCAEQVGGDVREEAVHKKDPLQKV